MKKYNIILLITLFLFYNCDNQSRSNIVTNDINEQNLTYDSDYANFRSNNNGIEKYSIDLKWNDYLKEDFISYEILDNNDNPIHSINNQSTISQTIDMSLNEFKEIKFRLNTDSDQQNIITIKVFTRPVSPVTDFDINAYNSYNQLSWDSSTDNDIEQLIIYRAELDLGSNLPEIEDNNGLPNLSVWDEIIQLTSNVSSYTDNDILVSKDYYYIIKVIDATAGYRYSYMNSNISGAVDNGITNNSYIGIGLTASENFEPESLIFSNKTYFRWNPYSYSDFYKFEIWRSENENFDIGSSDSDLIATITDKTMFDFEDYVSNNITLYYKMRLYNVYGNYLDSEEIECNTSL